MVDVMMYHDVSIVLLKYTIDSYRWVCKTANVRRGAAPAFLYPSYPHDFHCDSRAFLQVKESGGTQRDTFTSAMAKGNSENGGGVMEACP